MYSTLASKQTERGRKKPKKPPFHEMNEQTTNQRVENWGSGLKIFCVHVHTHTHILGESATIIHTRYGVYTMSVCMQYLDHTLGNGHTSHPWKYIHYTTHEDTHSNIHMYAHRVHTHPEGRCPSIAQDVIKLDKHKQYQIVKGKGDSYCLKPHTHDCIPGFAAHVYTRSDTVLLLTST